MANLGNNEALAATFAFGAVVSATLGTTSLYIRGGAASLFRDGPRLVLVLYLANSFLWAVAGFIAMLVSTNAASGCQVAVAFTSAFDQLARILLEQFLFWGMKSDVHVSFGIWFPQAIMILRFVLGGIFVGVQRPQFKSVCVGTTLVLPLGIAVLVADTFIVLMLFVRASSVGTFRDVSEKAPGWPRSRGLLLITSGLVVWIALSVPMILGMESFDLATRTVLPAVGLLVVIVLVALFSHSLTTKYDTHPSPYPPPLDAPPARDLPTRDLQSRDVSTIDTSYPPRPYTSVGTAPTSSRESRRDFSSRRISSSNISSSPERRGGLPIISRPSPGQAQAGVGGLPVQGQLFPPMRANTAPVTLQGSDSQPIKRAIVKGGKLVISNPIVSAESERGPLQKINTIDLATAARNEQERRNLPPHPLMSNLVEPAKTLSPEEMQNQPQNLKRKDVSRPFSAAGDSRQLLQPIAEASSMAASSSAQLSPGRDDVRRRSPRQVSQAARSDFPPVVPLKDVKAPDINVSRVSIATIPLVPPPRSPLRPIPQLQISGGPSLRGVSSTTSPRQPRSSIAIFTDPNLPPQIPVQSSGPYESTKPSKVASPRHSVEVLVPPVPPLSPRESPPPFYKSSGSQRQARQPLAGLARNGSVRADIRPSRQQAVPLAPEDQNKPVKTPVQLRQNNGIPSNPRARITRVMPKARDASDEQADTSVGDIEYDEPNKTKSIRDKGLTAQGVPDLEESSRDSVVHRPRPIPRRSPVKYSPLPKDFSKIHRDSRTRLVESKESRPSMLPQSAGILQPTTYSQPGAASTQIPSLAPDASRNLRRRSSLPDISLLPALSQTKLQALPIALSREITESFSTAEPPSFGALQLRSRSRQSKFVSKFSVDTSLSPLEEPRSGLNESPVDNRLSEEGARRRSSPVLPAEDHQDSPIPGDTQAQKIRSINDARLDGAGASAGDQTSAQKSAVAFKSPMWPGRSTYRFVDSALLTDDDDGKETMTVMLDQSSEYEARTNQAQPHKPESVSWHRRVGEDCPSFSDRKGAVTRRKVLSPPPLQLNKPARARKIIVAEPLHLESPQQALDAIKEQLKNFEELKDETPANDQQRLTLLADLEMEMGMQESRWQQMRQDYSRASVSTSAPSPTANSDNESSEQSPVVKAGVEASGSEVINDKTLRLNSKDVRESGFYSPYSAITATASRIQISRLNAAEGPLANDAVELLGESVPASEASADERTVPRSSPYDSPQFIASGEQRENHRQSGLGEDLSVETSVDLWRPDSLLNVQTSSPKPLWKPTIDVDAASQSSSELAEPPAASLRPVTRKNFEPLLDIESSGLWGESRTSSRARPRSAGLWKTPRSPSTPQEQQRKRPTATRPRTLRPPRRSRRISTLPDILEDPVPLLNKRGTLGIFQFPWGEKSDTGTVPFQSQLRASLSMAVLSGDMAPGRPLYPSLEAQVRGLQSQDYPSSFFDDYDDDGDGYVDSSDDDDSFDEETLWEIASLLRSDNVPSRESLLPGHAGSRMTSSTIVEDFHAGSPLPEDEDESIYEASPVTLDRKSSSPTLPVPATLWVDQTRYASVTKAGWLPQPDARAWRAYISHTSNDDRPSPRTDERATIESSALWSASPQETMPSLSHHTSLGGQPIATLWVPKPAEEAQVSKSTGLVMVQVQKMARQIESLQPNTSILPLWTPPKPTPKGSKGLGQPSQKAWDSYLAPRGTNRRSPTRESPPTVINSTSLWFHDSPRGQADVPQEELMWLTAKSRRTTVEELFSPPSTNCHDFRATSPEFLGSNTEMTADASAGFEILELQTPVSFATFQTTDAHELTSSLWVPPVAVQAEETEGLFRIGHYRSDYKNTVKKAAALETRPAMRTDKKPILQITSTSLWSSQTRHTFAHDWISLSTIRPSTPGGASSASGSESSFSDAGSAFSSLTGLSTVGSTLIGCPEDDGPPHNEHPDWDAGSQHAARPRQLARGLATAADWDTALEDAIRATGHEAVRPSSTPHELASGLDRVSALDETIKASSSDSTTPETHTHSIVAEPPQVVDFDSSRIHPVFAVSSLDTDSADVHPAGKGYFIQY